MASQYPTSKSVEDRASSMAGQIGEAASDIANKAGQKFEKVLSSAESTARSVAEQGQDAGQRVGEVAGNFKSALNKSVKSEPMATLAVATMLGFVLGALWKM